MQLIRLVSLRNLITAATAILLVIPVLAVQPPARDVIPGDGPAMRSPLLAAEPTLEWLDPDSWGAAAYPALLEFLAEIRRCLGIGAGPTVESAALVVGERGAHGAGCRQYPTGP